MLGWCIAVFAGACKVRAGSYESGAISQPTIRALQERNWIWLWRRTRLSRHRCCALDSGGLVSRTAHDTWIFTQSSVFISYYRKRGLRSGQTRLMVLPSTFLSCMHFQLSWCIKLVLQRYSRCLVPERPHPKRATRYRGTDLPEHV